MSTQIQLRRDTAATWTTSNPILAAGELGVESDTRNVKLGDGSTTWTSLPYWLTQNLSTSAVQTSNYTTTANQFVPVDTTSNAVTVTLPTAPKNGTRQTIKMVTQGSTSSVPNIVTITCGGSDVFNTTGGSTTKLLSVLSQAASLLYNAGIWYVVSDDLPLGQLDNRYQLPINVKSYGATGNGTTDDTAAINAAIGVATGSANPATTARTATGDVYLPPGVYKITSDLNIRSVVGFRFRGAGPELTIIKLSGTGFTQAGLFVNGSLSGIYEGFTVIGDGTEQVIDAIRLDWITTSRTDSGCGTTSSSAVVTNTQAHVYDVGATVTGTGIPSSTTVLSVVDGVSWTLSNTATATGTITATVASINAANRSTSGNLFRDIRIRNLNHIVGISLEGNGSRQVDGTTFVNVNLSGGQTANAWSSSGNWQKGVAFGSGTYGNNYDHRCLGLDTNLYYYGYYINASGVTIDGAQPAGNGTDFYVEAGAQCSFRNIQSQSAGQFLNTPNAYSPIPVTFEDILIKTAYLNGSSILCAITGGTWRFINFNATNLQTGGGGSYLLGTFNLSGSFTTRPATVSFENLVMNGARTSCIVPGTWPVDVAVKNYKNFTPSTGTFVTLAAGDVESVYTGGNWINIDSFVSATAPSIQWVTATGSYTWNKPVGAQTVDVVLCAGGGGGGSGAINTSASVSGGAGGSGGGFIFRTFSAADLPSSVTGTIGSGGNGGASVSGTSTTAGNNGSNGTSTTFGAYADAYPGSNGNGGGTGASSGGASQTISMGPGGPGAGGVVGAAGAVAIPGASASGGGAGGGATSSSGFNGSASSYSLQGNTTNTGSAGVVGGASPGTGTQPAVKGTTSCGGGGGAGASGVGATAQGGATPFYGGGGGGGGSVYGASGTLTSGAGGAGGNGFALIITHFV